jgi:hypothetical protein
VQASGDIDMKIVVIGGTRYIQLATVERLRQQGHDVVAASPQCRALTTAAPRDSGHAGRPLREFSRTPPPSCATYGTADIFGSGYYGSASEVMGSGVKRGEAAKTVSLEPTPFGERAAEARLSLSLRDAGPAGRGAARIVAIRSFRSQNRRMT